ncbi:sensor histidine kinase [Rhodopirellula sp. JC639]|uniref:sensor histidine kinase n=1 Tax=Stieleria mannarensis TaxID=2755585 RepID=UPI001600BC18|nr:ATP-binding protein [Rhodopirellula sp. JC639]
MDKLAGIIALGIIALGIVGTAVSLAFSGDVSLLWDTADYPPRWHCGRWTPLMGWLHIVSDFATWVAYVAIPIMLVYFARSQPEIPFRNLFWLFSVFILFCGSTHLMEAIIFWWPAYRLLGVLKLGTGIVSIATAVVLSWTIPKMLQMQSPQQLENKVTQRTAELELARLQLQRVIDQSRNFLGILDLDGTLLETNQASLTATGLRKEDVLNRPFWETGWWKDFSSMKPTLENAIADARNGQGTRFELKRQSAEGSVIIVDCSLQPMPGADGQVAWILSEGIDITDQRIREDELKHLNSELSKSNRELEQFAYVASHDLKEPLRKISSFAQLLQQEYGSKLSEEATEYIEFIVSSADRLMTLISDLLSISRISSQGKQLAPVDANAALAEAISNLQMAIEESGAEITVESFPTLIADPNQLTQLFQNLIENAIKYHGQNPPQIHVGGRQIGPQYECFVKDNGIGIEEKYAERIFEIFKRLHSRGEYPGTGVGLAICKKIVQRMGGRIWLESTPGDGSTFYFTINRQTT